MEATAQKPQKFDPAYQRDMLADQPYPPERYKEKDPALTQRRIEYVNAKFTAYRAAEGYVKFEKKNKTMQRLIRQELPDALKNSKFKLVTGMMRGARDNIRDFIRNTWDIDDLFHLTSKVQDPAKKRFIDDLNEYQLNFAGSIKYNNHVFRMADWFIEMGWACSHTHFQARNGWATKPKADPDAPGGILWLQEQDRLMGRPVAEIINPRNLALSPVHHLDEQPFQSFARRWYYRDVVRAAAMKTVDGRPVYNPEALAKLKEDFVKKQTNSGGKTQYIVEADTTSSHGANTSKPNEEPYVEVLYYDGPLCDVQGHEGDDNRYFLEVTDKLELRFRENTMDELWTEVVQMQSHPDKASPFGQCILDPMINYEKVNSFLIALGLEGQVDAMTKYVQLYEDDFLNPEVVKNPKNLVNILYAKDATSRPPQWLEPERSASLDDLNKIFAILDRWGQRVGTTDQELGVLGDATDKTATSAQMLFMAANKKNQAFGRRFADGLTQEYRQLLLLDLMHSDNRKKQITSRTGQPISLTPDHVFAFVSGSMLRVNDWITRSRGEELQKIMNAMTNVRDILMALGSPDPAVRMGREYLKTVGIKDVDEILPDPDKLVVSGPPAVPPDPAAAAAAGAPAQPAAGPAPYGWGPGASRPTLPQESANAAAPMAPPSDPLA